MRPTGFLESGCTSSKTDFQIQKEYEDNRMIDWPVEMGVATADEVAIATADELALLNYKASQKFELFQKAGINPFE